MPASQAAPHQKQPTEDMHSERAATGSSLVEDLDELLAELWRGYRKALKHCQRDFSRESIHALRIQTRRVLSGLDLVDALIASNSVKKIRQELKHRLAATGDLRDTQVHLQVIAAMGSGQPGWQPFWEILCQREERLKRPAKKAVRRLGTTRLSRLVSAIRKEFRAPFQRERNEEELRIMVFGALQRTFDKAVALWRLLDGSDPGTVHRLRVGFKRFRYLVELLQTLVPGVDAPWLARMRQYQAQMGEIQDLTVLQDCVGQLVAKGKLNARELRTFRTGLQRANREHLRDFLASADQIKNFWPL